MKRLLVLSGVLVLATLLVISTAYARAPVAFTWAAADLGQGCWGGGPLYADGSTSGSAQCSFFNGHVVGLLRPTSWTSPGPGFVTISFNVVAIKGSGFPPSLSDTFPVTGTPIKVTFPGNDQSTLIRVTPVR